MTVLAVATDTEPHELFTNRDYNEDFQFPLTDADPPTTFEDWSDVTAAEIAIQLQVPLFTARPAAVSWTTANGKAVLVTATATVSAAVDKAVTALLTVGTYDGQINLTRNGGLDQVIFRFVLVVSQGVGG